MKRSVNGLNYSGGGGGLLATVELVALLFEKIVLSVLLKNDPTFIISDDADAVGEFIVDVTLLPISHGFGYPDC